MLQLLATLFGFKSGFQQGDSVYHPVYGTGVVKKIVSISGHGKLIKISFTYGRELFVPKMQVYSSGLRHRDVSVARTAKPVQDWRRVNFAALERALHSGDIRTLAKYYQSAAAVSAELPVNSAERRLVNKIERVLEDFRVEPTSISNLRVKTRSGG